MDQSTYREMNHFRQATMIEDGSMCWVDDKTFDPAVHAELAPAAEPTE